MKANIKYDKEIAGGFHNTKYYECNEYNIKNQDFLNSETERLRTNEKENITSIINEKRYLTQEEKVFIILKNIYEKNKKQIFGKEENKEIYNNDLLNIVSSIPLLIVSYEKLKKNAGSLIVAYKKSETEYKKLNSDQKNLINKNDKRADGIDLKIFQETSRLLRKGKYPWGTSKKILIDKAGKSESKRPLPIPSFMDRVVQEAIRQILVAIYEPTFDKMNVSFGFRPNRSAQDVIYRLTNKKAEGLDKALEGDIKSAYDKINIKKLIEILGKKIKDRKFLKMIENRLNYEYYDKEKNIYVKDIDGIPEGGTDSPYLWNIYLLEFDIYIMTEIKDIVKKMNEKNRGINSDNKKITNNERISYCNYKLTIQKILNWIRSLKEKNGTFKEHIIELYDKKIEEWKDMDPIFEGTLKSAKSILKECDIKNKEEKEIIKILQKKQKIITHRVNNIPYLNINRKKLRFIYARYADDWIILTNMQMEMLKKIKEKISIFLMEVLYTILSDEKTLLTDIKIKPALFLGFEIRNYKEKKIGKYISITAKTAGSRVFAGIDKQRQIERLHMKGFCEKNGFPREITKLNNLEAFTIIDRTNRMLIGMANYYINFVRNPKSQLSRWVYLIRFSCLKTLAMKYRTTIRKIFDKFKSKTKGQTDTIEDTVTIEINKEKFSKTWRLYNLQTLMEKCMGKNQQIRKRKIEDRFWKLENNIPIDFEEKITNIIINNENYMERINWINSRTRASSDLSCIICGSEENLEMYHVKYVRKNLKKEKILEQVMVLRNRRQIPVCRFCYMNIIHKGKYGGTPLKNLSIKKMYENRIINSESYINKVNPNVEYKKNLIKKGWRFIKEKDT